jgi:hypothetical protein
MDLYDGDTQVADQVSDGLKFSSDFVVDEDQGVLLLRRCHVLEYIFIIYFFWCGLKLW